MRRRYRQIASKALKTKVMLSHQPLAAYIPDTKWLHKDELIQMLDQYPTVFVKPDKGGGGSGIVRIQKDGDQCELRWRKERHLMKMRDLCKRLVRFLSPSRQYIIQQGIEIMKVDGRPFDIRIMLQKPEEEWLLSGMVAKVAAPGQFVTNHCKGGRPLTAKEAIIRAFGKGNPVNEQLCSNLLSLSRMTVDVLNARFPGIKELGIDIGPDQQGHPWIFEVNTRPNFFVFQHLKQHPEQYRRILQHHKRLI
ncbi:YheC/D like ATP-grasp [Marininema mesophilum]|uniref:YheC/D like ATP-grasp n=1 Tax=Marininema mesophilum TaxID=1048340 RepID=A0A1H3AJS6_9BACL|nr:YheC/YheD family protein [Marininema mesophilum]SDX29628.1 YheC/D like ATP-grasp [Marininema mesophilum]